MILGQQGKRWLWPADVRRDTRYFSSFAGPAHLISRVGLVGQEEGNGRVVVVGGSGQGDPVLT